MLLSPRGFGYKPGNAERRFCTEVWAPTTWECARELARHVLAVSLFAFRLSCFLIFDRLVF